MAALWPRVKLLCRRSSFPLSRICRNVRQVLCSDDEKCGWSTELPSQVRDHSSQNTSGLPTPLIEPPVQPTKWVMVTESCLSH